MNKKKFARKLLVATLAFSLFTVPAFAEDLFDTDHGDPTQTVIGQPATTTPEEDTDGEYVVVTADEAPATPVVAITAPVILELDEHLRDLVTLSFGELRNEIARRGLRLTPTQLSALHRARLAVILEPGLLTPVAPIAPITEETATEEVTEVEETVEEVSELVSAE